MKHLVAATAVLPLLLLTGCGGSSDPKASGPKCPTLPTSDPSAKLPEGIPALDDQVLYEPSTQGKTQIVFGLLKQTDFVKVRDDLATKLKANGWTIDGTDQESVEAEAQFSKTPPLVNGTIKVAPLCTGYLSVRYKVNL
jgi:hypothetical protein